MDIHCRLRTRAFYKMGVPSVPSQAAEVGLPAQNTCDVYLFPLCSGPETGEQPLSMGPTSMSEALGGPAVPLLLPLLASCHPHAILLRSCLKRR